MKKYYIAMAMLAAISLGALIWQYTISRGAIADEQKVEDLTNLQVQIDSYAGDKGKAPASLSDIELDEKLKARLGNYEYSHTDDTFTLCATFATDASGSGSAYGSMDSPYWHGKGRQCFAADLLLYDYTDQYQNFDEPFDDAFKDIYQQ